MSVGTDVLDDELRRIAEVADAALAAAYPGIQIATPAYRGQWSVSLPREHGGLRIGTGATLAEAIQQAKGTF